MSIKQAIDALESCDPGDYSTGHVIHPSYDEEKVNAALAALRSMPAEPVAQDHIHLAWRGALMACGVSEADRNAISEVVLSILDATPHTEAVRMSEAEPTALFLLHAGKIDGDGEQDEWDVEADSGARVDAFCKLYPGQTIKLYPGPPPTTAFTDEEITRWWSSENGLEDMQMCKLHDFIAVVRAVEQATAARLGVKWGDV